MARAPLAEAVLTLIGSLASALGAGFILICYAILPQKRHFRHALIINLAVADFINGLNNSASGLYIISRRRDLPNGPGCVANGFIGQLSVQATDCNILLIAVVTLCGLREMILIPDASMLAKFLLCATAWILPIITSEARRSAARKSTDTCRFHGPWTAFISSRQWQLVLDPREAHLPTLRLDAHVAVDRHRAEYGHLHLHLHLPTSPFPRD